MDKKRSEENLSTHEKTGPDDTGVITASPDAHAREGKDGKKTAKSGQSPDK